jgi:hypothetical protein
MVEPLHADTYTLSWQRVEENRIVISAPVFFFAGFFGVVKVAII